MKFEFVLSLICLASGSKSNQNMVVKCGNYNNEFTCIRSDLWDIGSIGDLLKP